MRNAQPVPARDWNTTAAALLMLASGIIHFIIIPHHLEHAPAHGIAMGIFGAIEVVWAAAYWLRPSPRLARAGLALAAGLIVLWGITRVAPAPFTNEAEEVDFSGVLTKVLEAVAGLALLLALLHTAPQAGADSAAARRSARFSILSTLVIAVFLAGAVYTLARDASPLFPQLGPPAGMEHMEDMEH